MGHLDELYAKYKERGLVVLAITNEAKGLVEKFVNDTKATHPIVIEDSDSAAAYGINGFPSSFLVDANGKVAWSGHPGNLQEADIERLLPGVRLTPTLTKKLAGPQKSLEKGDYAGAKKSLDSLLAGTTLDDADRASAEAAALWIKERGESMLQSASEDSGRRDFHAAAETLRKAAESFKGMETGDKAKATLDEMLKDKDQKREVDAGDRLEKMLESTKKAKPEQAAAAFRAFAKQYEGTKAGEKALAKAVKLEAAAARR